MTCIGECETIRIGTRKRGRKLTKSAEDGVRATILFAFCPVCSSWIGAIWFRTWANGTKRVEDRWESARSAGFRWTGVAFHGWIWLEARLDQEKSGGGSNQPRARPSVAYLNKPTWNLAHLPWFHQPVFHPGPPPFTTQHRPSTVSFQAWTCGWGRPQPCLGVAPHWIPLDCPPSMVGTEKLPKRLQWCWSAIQAFFPRPRTDLHGHHTDTMSVSLESPTTTTNVSRPDAGSFFPPLPSLLVRLHPFFPTSLASSSFWTDRWMDGWRLCDAFSRVWWMKAPLASPRVPPPLSSPTGFRFGRDGVAPGFSLVSQKDECSRFHNRPQPWKCLRETVPNCRTRQGRHEDGNVRP